MESNENKPPKGELQFPEFRNSFRTVQKVTYLVGIDGFSSENDLNLRFFGSALFMVVIYVLCFYTGWVLRSDGYRFLEMSMILLLNMQGTSKIWVGFVHKIRYYELFQTSERIYACFDEDERNRPILRNAGAKMYFLITGIVITYVSSGLFIVISVGLYVIVTKEKFLALTVLVPFVDHTTIYGYLITYLTHMMMAAYCANGYLASDSAFIATVVPIVGYANSLQNEIRNFNILLKEPERDDDLILEKLRRLCKLHQMIIEYEQKAINHFNVGNLIQISFQSALVLLTIFLGYICGYMQAYSILLSLVFELTQYCALGTIITAKNDQMMGDIYDISWHLLTKSDQRMVKFMLHRAQNARDLSVGGMAPLNLVTYVQIMKTTYSFLTVLITMID